MNIRIPIVSRVRASVACLAASVLAFNLAGCATVPLPAAERPVSRASTAPPDSPLGSIARETALPAGKAGVWPLLQASFALDARVALIRQATTSIDLQSYLIADDSVGRLILRELRDAAGRGVRVRVLVDDLYTIDTDRLLLGLAATPNAEVRLFNPFVTSRNSSFRRLLALGFDFKRLNHRMHNKLFVVDGSVAVIGGRNLADEYFLRGQLGNFIDFDLLAIGTVVPELEGWFDLYWNSQQVAPIGDVVHAVDPDMPAPPALRAEFERVTAPLATAKAADPAMRDYFGAPPVSVWLRDRHFHFLVADAASFADAPTKIDPEHYSIPINDTLVHRFVGMLDEAKSELLMLSPYFIPGDEAMARIRQLRDDGVDVAVVTNSLAVSDEPLVSIRFERHQVELLKMGVTLYEMSSTRLKLDSGLRGLLGTSTGRLHAKLAFLDRRTVMLGSMNLDPRSAAINTEIGVRVESPTLAQMILGALKVDSLLGVYQVRLRPDGKSVRWVAPKGSADEELDIDPDTSFLQRLRLLLLSWFVPEREL